MMSRTFHKLGSDFRTRRRAPERTHAALCEPHEHGYRLKQWLPGIPLECQLSLNMICFVQVDEEQMSGGLVGRADTSDGLREG